MATVAQTLLGTSTFSAIRAPPARAPLSVASMLVFELDEESPALRDKQKTAAASAATRHRATYLASPHTLFESRLLRDVRCFKESLLKEDGIVDAVVLASRLSNVGYVVHLRTAIGGGLGQECFHNLNYEFIVVRAPEAGGGGGGSGECIVDPNFRDQFLIPQASPSYDELISLLPEEFVGPSGRLVPLVQLLCKEMAAAFEGEGAACPPWRQARSMVSKWLPARARDLDIASGVASFGSFGARKLSGSLSACVSPTTPLIAIASSRSGGTTSGGDSDDDVESPFQPRSIQAGFRLRREKSLLSSGLANSPTATGGLAQQAAVADPWAQPPIRTVRKTGTRLPKF